ncbi:MAG: prephenate dehydratase [Candidatus Goldbacteria bacterium]|nr:prephenate dehydratase [Candidatus Goldiibacteriota bacterium]
MKRKKDLSQYRKQIDAVDKEIVTLLHNRAESVKKIAQFKTSSSMEVYDPAREAAVLENLKKVKKGPFPLKGIEAVYNEIFSVSRYLQRGITVAYLGPVATYSHLAAVKRFGKMTNYSPAGSIKEVFSEVEKGNADYGCVPIENSTEGAVNYTYDMFADSDLKICSEILLKIEHCLISKESRLSDIKTLFVHPQTLGQCRVWIESNLPNVIIKEVSSNSKSAMEASKTKGGAGIAAELAAEIYGLKVLVKSVQDMSDNYTRFFIIGRTFSKRTGRDKTSIMVSIKDKPGALYRLLQPFDNYHVNLSNIESRPSKKKAWDYLFFVDVEGYAEDKNVKDALKAVEREAGSVKVLGSYPRF